MEVTLLFYFRWAKS